MEDVVGQLLHAKGMIIAVIEDPTGGMIAQHLQQGARESLAPVRDPIKNLVYNAQADDVETVFIVGQMDMRDRQMMSLQAISASFRS